MPLPNVELSEGTANCHIKLFAGGVVEYTDKLYTSLIKLPGIQEKRAKELIAAGVTKISDLKKEKYRKLLSSETIFALDYDISDNVPYEHVKYFITKLMNFPKLQLIPVGSYRRKKQYLKDIDFITTVDLNKVLNTLKESSRIDVIGEYSHGPMKLSMIIQWIYLNGAFPDQKPISYTSRVDIFKTTKENMPFALYHWTGSSQYVIRTKKYAKDRGYKLTQYGLWKLDKNGNPKEKIPIKTELDIMKYLGLTPREPTNRER